MTDAMQFIIELQAAMRCWSWVGVEVHLHPDDWASLVKGDELDGVTWHDSDWMFGLPVVLDEPTPGRWSVRKTFEHRKPR